MFFLYARNFLYIHFLYSIMEASGEVMAVWEFEKPNPREGDSVRVFWFTSVHESVGHFYAFSGIVFIHSRVGAEAYSI